MGCFVHGILLSACLCAIRASLIAQLVKNCLQCRRPWLDSWVGKIPQRRDRLSTPIFLGFPCRSVGKESACNTGDLGTIPGQGRSPGERKGYPLQCSGLENSMDCIYMGSQRVGAFLMDQQVKNPPAMQKTQETWVQSLGPKDPLEEEMAAHYSILA